MKASSLKRCWAHSQLTKGMLLILRLTQSAGCHVWFDGFKNHLATSCAIHAVSSTQTGQLAIKLQ
eukprot:4204260-Amphidinium_carterae.1